MGFYTNQLGDSPPTMQVHLRYDGRTVVMDWHGYSNLPPDCSYGRLDDLPARGIFRFRAREDSAGRLSALVPCWGWNPVGRFEADGTFMSVAGDELRRVDEDGLPDDVVSQWQICRPVYEAE